MRTAAPLAHLLSNCSRDHVTREQLGRAAHGRGAAGDHLGDPTIGLVFGIREVGAEHLRDVAKHESLALRVLEHATLAADPFGHEDAAHAERPDHPGRVKLKELHVDQFRSGFVGQRGPVAGVLPRIRRHLPRFAVATCGQHNGLGAEDDEASGLAAVRERTADPSIVLQQAGDGALHVDVDTRGVHGLVLQRPDHLEAGPISDVGEPRVLMAAEVALQDATVRCAIEERSPPLELDDARWGFAGEQLRHAPVVEHLAATHRVPEVDLPAVTPIGVGERRRHTAFRHDSVRLAKQGLADQTDRGSLCRRFDRGAQPSAARADDEDVVAIGLEAIHQSRRGSTIAPEATKRT